jgi:hypothetical protein
MWIVAILFWDLPGLAQTNHTDTVSFVVCASGFE